MLCLGSRKERMGLLTMRHLHCLVRVLLVEHGKLSQGCEGRWEVGEGRTLSERPMPSSGTQMKGEWRKGRSSLRTGCAVKQLGGMWLHLRVYRYPLSPWA